MKKSCLFIVILGFVVFSLAGVSYGWQGRMAGMGDPYGLVVDESDFLIHPAKIANGKGINFYGGYRFNYTDVGDWNITLTYSNPGAGIFTQYPFKNSGDEWRHEALLGAVFPLGPGKMGVLFEYQGRRGEYDGDVNPFGTFGSFDNSFSLKNPLDAFSLRVLYGLPIMGMDVGLDLGIDYKNEKSKSSFLAADLSVYTGNYIWGLSVPERALRLFMIPYDSNYWDFLWKLGMGKKFDSFDINATLKSSFIFSSKNKYQYIYQAPLGSNDYNVDMDGDVKGYRIGSDIWARAKLGEGMALPFLFSIDYGVKKWDGGGIGTGNTDGGWSYSYGHKEKELSFKLGGGLEKKLADNTLVAGGLYYNYLRNKEAIWFTRPNDGSMVDDNEFPSQREHQFMLRLAGEKNVCPLLTLRIGLNIFYSFVRENYNNYNGAWPTDFSLDGSRWGIEFGAPKMGVVGVALSTVFSRVVACAALWVALEYRTHLKVRLRDFFYMRKDRLQRILHIGLPAAGENVSWWLAYMFITSWTARMGDAQLATQSYVFQISWLVMLGSISIGLATEIKIGHLVGAGRFDDAFHQVKRSFLLGQAVSITMAGVVALAAPYILGVFTDNPFVIATGTTLILIGLIIEPGRVANLVVINALRATGDARFPVFVGIIFQWSVMAFGAWLLGTYLGYGLVGVWAAMAVDEWARGLLMIQRWRHRKWMPHALRTHAAAQVAS